MQRTLQVRRVGYLVCEQLQHGAQPREYDGMGFLLVCMFNFVFVLFLFFVVFCFCGLFGVFSWGVCLFVYLFIWLVGCLHFGQPPHNDTELSSHVTNVTNLDMISLSC